MVLIVEREAAIKIEMQQPKYLESFECLSARVLTHLSISFLQPKFTKTLVWFRNRLKILDQHFGGDLNSLNVVNVFDVVGNVFRRK